MLGVILFVLIGAGIAFILLQRSVQGGAVATVIGTVFLGGIAVPVWQSVGYFRTNRRHLETGGDPLLAWGGHLVLVAMLFASVSESIGSVLSLERFQARPASGVVSGPPRVTRSGTAIRIDGEIDYSVHAVFKEMLGSDRSIDVVELNSNGGLVYAARAIAALVLEQSLNTRVLETCNSACTLILAAGTHRSMNAGGRVGFHSYGRPTQFHQLMVDPNDEYAKDLRFMRGRGISEDFLARTAEIGNETMWFPGREELTDAGVITP
ncbi:MAG: hypothetical protein AAF479_07680 [Pseudomonadota bacterium]